MGIKLTKNIDLIASIYDRETSLIATREKLREKIDIDFYKVKDKILSGIKTLLSICINRSIESVESVI